MFDEYAPFTPTTLRVEMVVPDNNAALSNVVPATEAPKETEVTSTPPGVKMLTASPLLPSPTPLPPYAPMLVPNTNEVPHALLNEPVRAKSVVPVELPSKNTIDCPAPMDVTPRRATEFVNELLLSSIR